ncbi:beta-N-acetylhexosaminidase [Hymenobacter cellulosivorans]|uniref:Beta-N-acetylhexosaminidase n=1 Tax=Hymenobacter cellulosivorans TaxID=2932249 RepID=A0ABY4F7Z9_9BACT|nr:family 20 glycosylhydrolase [Hymenobacter cellulosivorans]UOQ52795.1 beta-N-acetylhexosaminidase [Hymenobacter cellulosivorans]
MLARPFLSSFVFVVFIWCLSVNPLAAQAPVVTDTRSLLPVPSTVQWGKSRFALKGQWRVQVQGPKADSALRPPLAEFGTWLGQQTNDKRLTTQFVASGAADLTITYGRLGQLTLLGDDEMYSLRVTPMGIALSANTHLGILRGLATLRQLLNTEKKDYHFAEVDIADSPRFKWRGLLVDAARHFMPLPVLKRNLDGMAAVKLNVLHWHLSDDQAFRVESKVLPRLHQVGGQFYTQDQVREVIRYAAQRGIRVIPEFDMPGHTTSWMAAYPELASIDSTYGPAQTWRTLNIALDPTKETTYQLIDKMLGEMTALFPDPYFHIGGDENDGRQWRRSPRIMAWAKQNGFLKDNGQLDKHALQTHFNRRILQFVTKYQKRMVGWDEILGPGLPEDAVIQSWRGRKGLYDAAKQGHAALLSNGYYLDLNLTAASHYLTDPVPADAPLSATQKNLILGGEATMWSEFADSVIIESRIWPRAAAVAERLWSAAAVRDVPDMYRRLGVVSVELETLGLRHRKAPEQLLTQLAGGRDVAALRTLAGVLEPVKEYKRHFQGFTYTPSTPLTRLVDAAPAESEAARQFGVAVEGLNQYLELAPPAERFKGASSKALLSFLNSQLRTWESNDQKLQPLFLKGSSLWEYAPLSTQLRQLAALGLERLQMLEKGQKPAAAWQATALKQLDAAKAPAGQAELAVVNHLRKLLTL